MSRIDLHTHSNASDGTRSPANLIRHAADLGLDIIALTDHDTVSGLPEAIDTASALSLQVVPGIELSADYKGRDLHMLGYFIDSESPELLKKLQWLRDMRLTRMLEMADRLNKLGYPVDESRIEQQGTTASVGRPHIARMMIERGYVGSVGEAFQRFLSRGRPAYVDATKLTPEETVQLVREAGGVPSMAHPYTAGDDVAAVLDDLELVRHGLVGLETYYGEYNEHQRHQLREIADSYGLIPTGGSDYHDDGFKHGRELGQVDLPDDTVDRLYAARPA